MNVFSTRWIRPIALCIATLATSALQAQQTDTPSASGVAATIVLDYQGGRFSKAGDPPALTVYPDGNVIMGARFAKPRGFRGQITEQELQELLYFISVESQFFDLDEAQAKTTQATVNAHPIPVHTPTTVLKVNHDGLSKTISIRQPKFGPVSKEFSQVAAITQRLESLMSQIELQSVNQLAALLAAANGEGLQLLASESADAGVVEFTSADLVSGAQRADGSVNARFRREDGAAVIVEISAGGARSVAVVQ